MDDVKAGRRFLKTEAWRKFGTPELQTDQGRGLPRAPAQKPYPEGSTLVDLCDPEKLTVGNMPVREAIGRRRSRRSYTADSLSLEELSFLLWATQGVRQAAQLSEGVATTRTVPSGGSLHTFETYLLIDRVDGVEHGLYRYLPLEHKLLFLRADPEMPRVVSDACRGQNFVGQAAAVFMWTTNPYRMEWRYSIVSHKIIALDAGHLCQNLYLAAESIGAGTCAIGAYFQDEMDGFLGVDGEDEFTIYVAPVGKVG